MLTSTPQDFPATRLRLQWLALSVVFLWFLIGGIAHFAATRLEMSIVPPYVPWPRLTVLVTGVLELLGAAGLLFPTWRRAAGWGLFLLTILVTPANIYMLQRPDLFTVPYWVLLARLPVQIGLLALIVWGSALGTRRRRMTDVVGTPKGVLRERQL